MAEGQMAAEEREARELERRALGPIPATTVVAIKGDGSVVLSRLRETLNATPEARLAAIEQTEASLKGKV